MGRESAMRQGRSDAPVMKASGVPQSYFGGFSPSLFRYVFAGMTRLSAAGNRATVLTSARQNDRSLLVLSAVTEPSVARRRRHLASSVRAASRNAPRRSVAAAPSNSGAHPPVWYPSSLLVGVLSAATASQ